MLSVSFFNLAILSCILLAAAVEMRSFDDGEGKGDCCRKYRQRMESIRDLNVKIAERIKYLLEIEKKRMRNERHTCTQSTQPIHNQIVIQLGQNKSNINEATSHQEMSRVEGGNTNTLSHEQQQQQQSNMGIDFFQVSNNGEFEELVNEAVEHSKCPIGKVHVRGKGCVPIIENFPLHQVNSAAIIDNESEIINSNFKIFNKEIERKKISGNFARELENFLNYELERLKTLKSEKLKKIELNNLQILCNKIREKMKLQRPTFQVEMPIFRPQPPKYEGKLIFPKTTMKISQKPKTGLNFVKNSSGMKMTIENLLNELKTNSKDESQAFLNREMKFDGTKTFFNSNSQESMENGQNFDLSKEIEENKIKEIIETGKELGNEITQEIRQQIVENQAKMIMKNAEMKIENPTLIIDRQFSKPDSITMNEANKLEIDHNGILENLNSMKEQKLSSINEMIMNAKNREMKLNKEMEVDFSGAKLQGIDGENLSQSKIDTSQIVHPKNQLTKMYIDMMASIKKGTGNSEIIQTSSGNVDTNQLSIDASSMTNSQNKIENSKDSNLYSMILGNNKGNMEMNLGKNNIENVSESKHEWIIKLLDLWKSGKTHEIEILLKEKPELIEIYNHIKSTKTEAQTAVEEEIKKEENQIDEGEIGLNAGETIQTITSEAATEVKQIPSVKIIKEEIPAKIIMKAQLPNGQIMKVSEHSLTNITSPFEMNVPIPVVKTKTKNIRLPFGATAKVIKSPLKSRVKLINGRRSAAVNQQEEIQATTTEAPKEALQKSMSIFSFDPKVSKNPKTLIKQKNPKEDIENILKNLNTNYNFKSIKGMTGTDFGNHNDENEEHSVENKTKTSDKNVEQKSVTKSENYEENFTEKSTTNSDEISTQSTTTVSE